MNKVVHKVKLTYFLNITTTQIITKMIMKEVTPITSTILFHDSVKYMKLKIWNTHHSMHFIKVFLPSRNTFRSIY